MHHVDPNEIAVGERGREGEVDEGAVGGGNPEEPERGDGQRDHVPGGYGGRPREGICREPHRLDPLEPPEPDPMLILGSLMDALRMAGLRANPRHVREFR